MCDVGRHVKQDANVLKKYAFNMRVDDMMGNMRQTKISWYLHTVVGCLADIAFSRRGT
jgi:hypothetical protein